MKLNYYRATEALISFKDHLQFVLTKKNERVINFLKSVELNLDADKIGVPDVTTICAAVNLPRNKVHPIIYEAYNALLEVLGSHPAEVPDCVHAIYIYEPDDLAIGRKRTKAEEQVRERELVRSFWGEFRLRVTPRVGETISLDFIDGNIKHSRGVVTDVEHEIWGLRQRIVINVHPSRNYYWKWKQLEREDRERDLWLARLKEVVQSS